MRTKAISLIVAAAFCANVLAQEKIKTPTSVAPQPASTPQQSASNELAAVKPLSEAGKVEAPSSPKATTPAIATPGAQPNATITANGSQPIGVVSTVPGGFNPQTGGATQPAKKKASIELLRIADGDEKKTALLSVHGISKRVSVGESVLTFFVGDIGKDSVCLKKSIKQKGCTKTVHFDD